jgi:TolB-like protein
VSSPALVAVSAAALLLAGPARPDDLRDGARRVAEAFAAQLAAKLPRSPPPAVAVAPLRLVAGATEAGAARPFVEALEAALAERKVTVRDWAALDATLREQLLSARAGSGPATPRLGAVQALVTGEVIGAGDPAAPVRVTVRLVAVSTGAVLAAESAGFAPRATAARPAPAAAALAPTPLPGPAARPRGPAAVDVAMRRVGDALAAGFQKLPGGARYQRLAVLEFGETGADARKHELGTVVSAELATNLRRDHGFLLVERAKLKQVLGELRLGEMGLVDPAVAPKLGKLADAQALVMGNVAQAGDRFLVNARIVSTETAETLAAASEPVAAASLVALSSEAVVLRSRKDGAFRSLLVPGWGQVYNREPLKAGVILGTEVALLGAAGAFHLAGGSAKSDYQKSTDPAKAASLRADAQRDFRWRNGLLVAAGALWVLNVADAYLSGVDGDRLVAGAVVTPGEGQLVLAGRF